MGGRGSAAPQRDLSAAMRGALKHPGARALVAAGEGARAAVLVEAVVQAAVAEAGQRRRAGRLRVSDRPHGGWGLAQLGPLLVQRRRGRAGLLQPPLGPLRRLLAQVVAEGVAVVAQAQAAA